MSSFSTETKRLTLRDLQAKYRTGEKLAVLTSYDSVTANLVDAAGVDMILVGDSLGNVVLGLDTTIPVSLEAMILHTRAVVRGSERALVICDLPFGTTYSVESTMQASIKVFQETECQAVKLEGGEEIAPIVKALTQYGIPVMCHIGLRPQSVHQMGGYFRHGKNETDAKALIASAKALEEAGAFSIVLECIVPEVTKQITDAIQIPTIGIGSGSACSGQVLVINDLIGLSLKPPPSFAKPKAQIAPIIQRAAEAYVNEVKGLADSKTEKQESSHGPVATS